MHPMLHDLVGHMRWADALIAEALERDAPEDAESARLFAHIASVEHLWFSRIQGRPAAHAVWPSLGVADSRALAAQHADLFEQLTANDDELARRVAYVNSAGKHFESTVADIVTHTAMHGSHHRGQILRMLRAAGCTPPYVDYIQYTRRDQ